MSDIKFNAIIREAGGCFVVTIPKNYVDNGLLDSSSEYTFVVTQNGRS